MSQKAPVSINNSVDHKEYENIQYVLKNYDIKPDNIEKVRGVYKISCNSKCYCLKRVLHGDKKALKGMKLAYHLKSSGFDNVADYINAKDGSGFIKCGKSKYYLTEWIEGREFDFNNFSEVKNFAVLLAQFHLKSNGFYDKHSGIEDNIKNWPDKLEKEKTQLDLFKNIIERKKIRTSFDNRYYQVIDSFKQRMEVSLNLLKDSQFNNLSQDAQLKKTICHNSFGHQNILAGDSGKLYLIDLDNIVYDLNVFDLAKYVRRLLHKNIYYWNFNAARELIEAYSEVRPLSRVELKVFLALLIFPHKFWKLGKRRYEKKKKWEEDKYLKKLDKIIKHLDYQNAFIDSFLKYFSIPLEI